MSTRCFICNNKIVYHPEEEDGNIFTSRTNESGTPVYKFIEQFIGHEIKVNRTNCIGCKECFLKLNEYDTALCTTQKIQNELSQLLRERESFENKSFKEIEISHKDDIIQKNSLKLMKIEKIYDKVSYVIEAITVPERSNEKEIKSEYLMNDDGCYEILVEEDGNVNEEQDEYFGKENEITVEIEEFKIGQEEKNVNNEKDDVQNDENIFPFETMSSVVIEEKQEKTTATKLFKRKKKLCKLCNENFASTKELHEHRKKKHSEQRFVCDICGMSYKSKASLKIHIGMHYGENPFRCEICNKCFTQKGALKRHNVIHTGERKFQCEKCGKQFIHYSSFYMHNLAHNDVRNQTCELCGIRLRSTSHLNRHMLVHTGQKPHACPKCGQTFAQRYNMNSHIKYHHQGIRRINKRVCKNCGDQFGTVKQLKTHLDSCTSSPTKNSILNMNFEEIENEQIEFEIPVPYE